MKKKIFGRASENIFCFEQRVEQTEKMQRKRVHPSNGKTSNGKTTNGKTSNGKTIHIFPPAAPLPVKKKRAVINSVNKVIDVCDEDVEEVSTSPTSVATTVAAVKRKVETNSFVVDEPSPGGQGDAVAEVLSFWTAQVIEPHEIFQSNGWPETSVNIETGEELYSIFHKFIVAHGSKEGGNMKPCSRPNFLSLSKHFITGFTSTSAVTVPRRDDVRLALNRLVHKVYHHTARLEKRLNQCRSSYSDGKFRALHLLVTPSLQMAPMSNDESYVSYYNAGPSGTLTPESQVELTKLKDMPMVHPLFTHYPWKELLWQVAGLAALHSMHIFFRYDAARYFEYVMIHDQRVQLEGLREETMLEGMAKFSMKYQTTFEEEDLQDGNVPAWFCEVDVPDKEGPEGQVKVSEILPGYRGLRIRFMFRQDYNKWFFG